ncbi:hypothetical protein ACJJTC_017664 [Scirpophaga incertulas]
MNLFYKLRTLRSYVQRSKRNINYSQSNMSNPIVTVTEGKLRGSTNKLFDGSTYYSFKGIPYAQPPIGTLRFKAPLPSKPWSGTLDAFEHGPVCPQFDINTLSVIDGDENCLYLNVYTRSLQPSSKLPVMVFIHGGGFLSGSGNEDMLGPKFLLQHNVILVTINYRLEVFGFLCLDTPEVPGNAGMKDQVIALQWIKNNISQFGGDADNICLFGESAGGASVTYHMVSPMSEGLFHKAIVQSGVCFEDWANGVDGRQRAFRLGKLLGKETTDSQELLEFLQSVPPSKLTAVTLKTKHEKEINKGLPFHFTPIIEKRFKNVNSFLNEDPIDMILEKNCHKVPLMIGCTSHEGIISLRDALKKAEVYNKHPENLLPRIFEKKLPIYKLVELGQRVKKFYVEEDQFSKRTQGEIIDLQSDLHFVYNVNRFAHFYSFVKDPIFMYRFAFDTQLNFVKMLIGLGHVKGTCHADDLFYIFSSLLNNDLYTQDENVKNNIMKVTKLWTNFAKTGNPTPDKSLGIQWTPYTQSNSIVLNIDECMTCEPAPEVERIEFWNKLYREARLPFITKSNL